MSKAKRAQGTGRAKPRPLEPEALARIALHVRICARALQLSEPYRKLLSDLRATLPGVDIVNEFKRIEKLPHSQWGELGGTWNWLRRVYPLDSVGALDIEDTDDIAIGAILATDKHIWDALPVFGITVHALGPFGDHDLDPDDLDYFTVPDVERTQYAPHGVLPDDRRHIDVTVDLGKPDSDLQQGLRALRWLLGRKKPEQRPQRAREWAGEYGWKEAFELLVLSRGAPKPKIPPLVRKMWPHLKVDKASNTNARRLLKLAREQVEIAGRRLDHARAWDARNPPLWAAGQRAPELGAS